MNVPLLDLKPQYAAIKDEIDAAVADVVASQRFVLGPVVEACEEALAAYCGCDHGVGVSSGTDALLLALMAEGIGPGDEVVVPSFTFFATAGVVARVGATPVFADIDPSTFNIDPAQIEAKVTSRTRAVVPVHLFGQMAEMDPIMEVARRRGLIVIEDVAQAIGAERDGRRAGSVGHYGCFSFFPTKNLGAFGDAGMITTNDPARHAKLKALRVHGEHRKYHHSRVGGNFRLDALQASVVRAKLPHLDAWTEARQRNAALYGRLVGEAPEEARANIALPKPTALPTPTALPQDAPGRDSRNPPRHVRKPTLHVYNQFVVQVPQRDKVRERLAAAGVGSGVYYPIPLHLQECFADLGHAPGDFPASERAAAQVLALPIYPELPETAIAHVVSALVEAVLTS